MKICVCVCVLNPVVVILNKFLLYKIIYLGIILCELLGKSVTFWVGD